MPSDACCVPGCAPSTLLHRFPDDRADPERATEWRQRLDVAATVDSLVCCGRHFSDGQYEGFDRAKPLKPDAVPDCNLPKIKLEVESVTSLNNNIEVAPEVIMARSSLELDRFKQGTFTSPSAVVVENLDKLCRLCLEMDESGTHQPLFGGGTDGIVDSIQQSIGIEIDLGDPFPKQICPVCIERVNYIQRSREWFLKNDNLLKALFPEAIESVPNDDLIIPDLIPATSVAAPTEAIFFKEEAGEEGTEDDRILLQPLRKRAPASKVRKKRTVSGRPTSFCTMCSREFECPRDLRTHLYSAHQGVICKHCGVAYSHPGTLQMHIKQHHGEKERLAEWKEQAAQNLFREMAEKFNGGVGQVQGGGGGGGGSTGGVGDAGADTGDWKGVGRGRPKRQKHK
uniref:(northern house mosquito) hypothetical protein n=1 Tax=Culex pipiens TaxID=7175 RepID=A0A8D8CG35_CULPI